MRRLHRWIALPLALFLIVQGVTGSAIAWMHELDVWLNPELMRVTPTETQSLSVPTLLAHLNASSDYANPSGIELPARMDEVIIASYKKDKAITRQVMVNPYTATIIGERNWGEIGISRPLLMPTLFLLHRQLLAGEVGKTLVSINGILLIILAASGIYLWWPLPRARAWLKAVTMSFQGSWRRINFSVHRAAGFYCAPLFIVMAVTGIYFNKPQWIIPTAEKMDQPTAVMHTNLTLEEILQVAQDKFPTARISRINFPKKSDGIYEIRLHQPGELRDGSGATRIRIDAIHGRIVKMHDPLTTTEWERMSGYFFPVHSGEIFGVVGKIVISLIGMMPLLFAISGITIWLRRISRLD